MRGHFNWHQQQRNLFLFASGLSTAGSFAGLTAKGWILMSGTQNAMLLALHFAALSLPTLLVSGPAGVRTDRIGWNGCWCRRTGPCWGQACSVP